MGHPEGQTDRRDPILAFAGGDTKSQTAWAAAPAHQLPPAEGCSIRRKKPTVVSNQTLFTPGPTAQIPNAKSKPSESSSAMHIPQGNDTGYLGGEQGLGSQQGARTPSSLTHGLGGDSFPPPHELGWQGAAPSPPCPVSQGQLSSEPLGAAPGAALRAAHTGARGLGAPRDPRAGLWGAAGSVLRQRLGRKKVFPSLGFCYVFSQETPKRSS